MKPAHALWIDRWSKYIGLAYTAIEWSDVIFPIGYVMNDSMTYYYIADLIQRYHIRKIVLWWPNRQKDVQEKITKFMESLNYIIEINNLNFM